MTAQPRSVSFTILGEPASKANSRKIVTFGKGENARSAIIKSDKARSYWDTALKQIPPHARMRLEGKVFITIAIHYATERPDLDESVILDVLQDQWHRPKGAKERYLVQHGVYRNDRQVRGKYVTHHIDRLNPRAEILVEEIPEPPKAKPTRRSKTPASPSHEHAQPELI
ncbi:MAG: hypothetical protein IIA02_10700 [Proteobacteria bacterium]|nr:hypothetical protein [Pseudomonadota bacterium]